jgi:hypothetical protein
MSCSNAGKMVSRRTVCFGGEGKAQAGRYFRADLPAKAIGLYGWRAETAQYPLFPQTEAGLKRYGPMIRGWDGENQRRPRRPCSIVTIRIMDDVVVDPVTQKAAINYKMDSMAADITRAREAGQIVLYDVDDDIWHLPEWSPAAMAMHKLMPNVRACDLDVVDANIRSCDGVLVSTPYLKKVVEAEGFGVPVYLMRPGIDSSVYLPKSKDRPLRVGWMGSMSHHLQHLRTMQVALAALPKYNAEFLHMGWLPGDRSDVLLEELVCRKGQMRWGDIASVPEMLRHVDIGLIPRVPTTFNESQSVTSGLQYAASGTPFLVSPSEEYSRLEELGAGKVCRTVPDWRQGIEDLLSLSSFRRNEAERAKECVEAEFGLRPTGRHYHELFTELLEKRA